MALKLDSGTILGLFFTYITSWDTGKKSEKIWKSQKMSKICQKIVKKMSKNVSLKIKLKLL